MKRLLISISIALTICFLIINTIIFLKNDDYISELTEKKYIRNIHKFKPEMFLGELFINPHFSNNDTLSFFSEVLLQELSPFYKWHIYNVGCVRPGSILEKKIDSIAATYIEPENKLK